MSAMTVLDAGVHVVKVQISKTHTQPAPPLPLRSHFGSRQAAVVAVAVAAARAACSLLSCRCRPRCLRQWGGPSLQLQAARRMPRQVHGGVQLVALRGWSIRGRSRVVQGAQGAAASAASGPPRLQQQRQQAQEQVQDSARGAGGLVPSARCKESRGLSLVAATAVCRAVAARRSTRGRACSVRSALPTKLAALHKCRACTVCSTILQWVQFVCSLARWA